MDVLQHAAGVVRHLHAQIFLIFGVPRGGQLRHRQRALDQRLFQLIPHHHVQGVGQLVRLGADQPRLRPVHRPVKFLAGHARQLGGEQVREGGPQVPQKRRAAPHIIFKQTALAFVQAHGGTAGQHREIQRRVAARVIQGMAALVGHAVQVAHHVRGLIMGGDAHIPPPEPAGEGVFALGQRHVGGVKPPQLHDFGAQGPLGVHGPVLPEKIRAHRTAPLLNVRQQRHNGFAQCGEKGIAPGDGQPPLVPVQPDLIGVPVRVDAGGLTAARRHDFFQIRRKGGEVVALLGLGPRRDGLLGQAGEGGVLLGGNVADFIVLTLEFPHLGFFLSVLRLLGGQRQQGGGVIVDEQVKFRAAQHLRRHGAAIGAVGGGGGGLVKFHDAEGILIGIQLFFQSAQGGDGVFHKKIPLFQTVEKVISNPFQAADTRRPLEIP